MANPCSQPQETLQLPDDLILLSFDRIMQTRSYTVFVLGNNNRQMAIYADPAVGRVVQMHLSGSSKPRPLTHDLIILILKGLDAKVIRVVITDVRETVYFAKLCIEQQQGEMRVIVEIDARPSDCITIAVMMNISIYCTRSAFEQSIPFGE